MVAPSSFPPPPPGDLPPYAATPLPPELAAVLSDVEATVASIRGEIERAGRTVMQAFGATYFVVGLAVVGTLLLTPILPPSGTTAPWGDLLDFVFPVFWVALGAVYLWRPGPLRAMQRRNQSWFRSKLLRAPIPDSRLAEAGSALEEMVKEIERASTSVNLLGAILILFLLLFGFEGEIAVRGILFGGPVLPFVQRAVSVAVSVLGISAILALLLNAVPTFRAAREVAKGLVRFRAHLWLIQSSFWSRF